MDKIVFSIYKTQDNKFLVEDRDTGIVYAFNRYDEIIDACPNSDGFQFDNREQGTIPLSPKGKIDIYERIFPKEAKGYSQPSNNYGWHIAESNPPHGQNNFPRIAQKLLESIRKEMRW